MKNFTIIRTPDGLKVKEFYSAAKFVAVPAALADFLISLSLHTEDLEFAQNCISAMNEVPPDAMLLHKALWRTALVHFYKCFNSGVRSGLKAREVFCDDPHVEQALEIFEYYQHVRDKHVVHDVNHMTQCTVGAVLNDGRKNNKIDQIVCVTGMVELVDNVSFGNLQKLVSSSIAWVDRAFDAECKKITSELEKVSYDELLRSPAAIMPQEIEITKTSIKVSRKNRPKHAG